MNKSLNLREKHRQALKILVQHYLPEIEVWAYGSRINGRSHDGSDLDLVLRSPDLMPIDNKKLHAFIEALRESNIPFLVEARDWATLPEDFQNEIKRNYLVLLEKNTKNVN